MTGILIDSDIVVEVSRGRNTALVAQWEEVARGTTPCFCSPVTVAEIWAGARESEEAILSALFGAVGCIPIDAAAGQLGGEYLRRYAKSHGVELGDALIAATAVRQGFALWTRNRRHYPMREVVFL